MSTPQQPPKQSTSDSGPVANPASIRPITNTILPTTTTTTTTSSATTPTETTHTTITITTTPTQSTTVLPSIVVEPYHWYPCDLLSARAPVVPYAILILNQPINRTALDAIIQKATVVVCADGGANRLYEYHIEKEAEMQKQSENQNQNPDHNQNHTANQTETQTQNKNEIQNESRDQHQDQDQDQTHSPNHHDSNLTVSLPPSPHKSPRLPDAIVGDLDSISPYVEAYYRDRGVRVLQDTDQYATDFMKSLKWIRSWVEDQSRRERIQRQTQSQPQSQSQSDSNTDTDTDTDNNTDNNTNTKDTANNDNTDKTNDTESNDTAQNTELDNNTNTDTDTNANDNDPDPLMDVVVFGGLGGRVDQAFSQIHHLYKAWKTPAYLCGNISLLSETSLSFVLNLGPNIIHVEPGYFEENVGIIPVLGPTRLTTKGLQWDVENWPTSFSTQISTSNHIRADEIHISFKGTAPLFTMELNERFAARS